jgi:hypothetical protein
MIRYAITYKELKKRIGDTDPTWFTRAAAILAKLPAKPTSKSFPSLWSDIKEVYIELQSSKCIYCETLIEGNISNDIEHFRPKAKVSPWKVPGWLAQAGLKVSGPATPKGNPGYYSLAYQPLNYAASCKFCNSVLKKNLFPITGKQRSRATDPRKLKGEGPLLIYPISTHDANPETLIRFVGMHPEPAIAPGEPGYFRAVATIELFRLNDADRRKELFISRALVLDQLHGHLETRRNTPSGPARDNAERWIKLLLDGKLQHANCLRCFKRLHASSPNKAQAQVDDALSFLQGDRSPRHPLDGRFGWHGRPKKAPD